MTTHIAVDIGGTRMRAATYRLDSLTPLKIDRIKTRKKGFTPQERLEKLIASVWPEDDEVAAIGIAVPGPVNSTTGTLEKAPNVPELSGLPISKLMEDSFHVPVLLGNDANMAALGEWKFGAGRGHHHMIYLTISTGIGSGVIIEDKLFLGAHGFAAELGHTMALPDGPICGCGVRGHLETVASGTAIAKWVSEQISNGSVSSIQYDPNNDELISGAVIAEAARNGDELALQAFKRAGTYLGRAIADFLHVFNPTIIVLGGGVSQSYELFSTDLYAALKAHLMAPNYLDELEIVIAELGDDVGLMGALALARESTG